MPRHIRIIGTLWTLVGVALVAWAIWGLIVEEHYRSVVESWLIALGYGAFALLGGLPVALGTALGRIPVRIVAVLGLLYIAAYIVFGGFRRRPWLCSLASCLGGAVCGHARGHQQIEMACGLTSRSTRTLLGGPAARPSSRRLAWFVRAHD